MIQTQIFINKDEKIGVLAKLFIYFLILFIEINQ